MTLIKKFLTFFGLKKNKFIVFGVSVNIFFFIYRTILRYNHKGSLILVDKNLEVIVKILEYGFIFFSVILCSLYLKNKKEENLDKILVKFKFFPKTFFFFY